ncbi:MAG: S8 family serine peptidase, partial [Clostridiales Family XIII bacterium]|nr:S8 family serine peptidase [Clostridiales Family XIII bacterium]
MGKNRNPYLMYNHNNDMNRIKRKKRLTSRPFTVAVVLLSFCLVMSFSFSGGTVSAKVSAKMILSENNTEEEIEKIEELTIEPPKNAEYDGFIVKKEDGDFFTVEKPAEALTKVDAADIEYIEPDYEVKALGFPEDADPDDNYFSSHQWELKESNGINVQDAWETGLSGKDITVAVIDTGINASHEDLSGQAILSGYNFTGLKVSTNTKDGDGHGTFIAGQIAAATNNKIGIAAPAYNAKILPLKALNDKGVGEVSWAASAIDKAVELKVDVINLSYGCTERSITQSTAIKKAIDAGIIVVAAAGNNGDNSIFYPSGDND